MNYIRLLSILSVVYFVACTIPGFRKVPYDYSNMDRATRLAHYRVEKFLDNCKEDGDPVLLSKYTRIDTVIVDREKDSIHVYFNRFLAHIPFRDKNTTDFYDALQYIMGRRFASYSLTAYVQKFPVEQLIPNYYRGDKYKRDYRRDAIQAIRPMPVVRSVNKAWQPGQGLYGRNIALWHSHGWYYEQKLNRWEWQRARLFQTVEDLGPFAFTVPYLIPMLENAGANVFVPRERDVQINEVVIDNDNSPEDTVYYRETTQTDWQRGADSGFAVGHPPYESGVNPFRQGSFRQILSSTTPNAKIEWTPDIPETGNYAVYVSYFSADSNVNDAHYSVYHSGGKTKFLVNQKIGGRTWIYLDTFRFKKGLHPDSGKVVLTNQSAETGAFVTADAVRFGGGMGNISRGGQVSKRPRFTEGARYYLQYAGMPDTLVFNFSNDKSDYRDDYQSRGEWVNYLMGKPFGPNKNRAAEGLGIPVDLSLAFHTDAGISSNDTVIGTLSIYSTWDADSALNFPDSVSRLANRDFADILQTQIVEDIRKKYDPVWNRRGLWDRQYSEAFRPNTPAALLELLSHQNFLDVKFQLDPRYRFDVSRAIYKAMLRFIADRNRTEYIVQPLPVDQFHARFSAERQVSLHWRPREDPLEPSASAKKYVVYQRIEDNEFDNGRLVDHNEFTISGLMPGVIYGYKITAVNDGGESFPSEILSVCWQDSGQPVLIINGFDRISGPAAIEYGKFRGFANFIDMGVPDKYDLGYTGRQFNFNADSPWKDDDEPGFGASYADKETKVLPGNTFDFSYIHGRALRSAGLGFVSVSDESVMEKRVDITTYPFVDLIMGEEKSTPGPKPFYHDEYETFPPELRAEISHYCDSGGNLLISGAYIGSDLFIKNPVDSVAVVFAKSKLKFFLRTDHAVKTGGVFAVDSLINTLVKEFEFNTEFDPDIYLVEAPDAIEPADSGAVTILRYTENNMSAAIGYRGPYNLVAMGFPFETITDEYQRNKLMQAVLLYLTTETTKERNIIID